MEMIWHLAEQYLVPLVPSLLVVALSALVLKLVYFRSGVKTSGQRFREQLLTFFIVLAALIGLLLTLPLESDSRGQLLTLLGLLLTAIVTLSSSTVAANAMAGVMLRSLRNFSPGDFISVGDHFGRVTEQDLFHTEIQTQDRDLLALPNLYLATNPVKVVHASGTLVSAEVSLGYDVDYRLVDKLLSQAVLDAELEEPFVYLVSLGDYSVTYRVSGFLEEVNHLLSSRSRLHKKMLDQLHGNGVEIVSPAFMNQRQVENKVFPQRSYHDIEDADEDLPEKLIFDKADRAQKIKDLQTAFEELKLEIDELNKSKEPGKQQLIEGKTRRLQAIERALVMLDEEYHSQ